MSPAVPRRVLAPAAAVLAMGLLAGPALGHASLVSSDPADGSAVPISQATSVTLTFDDDLDPAKSEFLLVDAAGATAATGHVGTDPKTMLASGLSLAWGAYQARWTAIASDGDLTRGIVSFQAVGEGAVSIGPSAAAPASGTATSASAPGTSGATSASDVVLPTVAGLVLVAVVGVLVLRRSRSA